MSSTTSTVSSAMMPLLIAVIGHFHRWSARWNRRIDTMLAAMATSPTGRPVSYTHLTLPTNTVV